MKIRSVVCIALPVAAVSIFAVCTVRGSGPAPQSSLVSSELPVKGQGHEVVLPVLVLDKHNQLVTNLTASEFSLTDDGRPQKIESLTQQSGLPFRLGLLVDTGPGVYSAIDSERKAAAKFVDLMLPAEAGGVPAGGAASSPPAKSASGRAEAFLIHFDRQVELLEDFTGSRDKLHREIADMAASSREPDIQTGPESSGDDGYGQHSAHESGPQLYDAIYLACDELMKPKHGRKALVVFSDGADHGSKETLNDAIDAADRANVQVFTIYIKPEEQRSVSSPGGHHGGYPGVGYPGGGGWPGGGGGDRGPAPRSESGVDGRVILQQIASRTGGQYFEAKRKENLDGIYNDVAMLLHTQYVLTYTPDKTDSDGDFHKVVLKANSKEMTVYTREGYYWPSE